MIISKTIFKLWCDFPKLAWWYWHDRETYDRLTNQGIINFMKSDLGRIFRLKYAGGKYAPIPRPRELVDIVDKDTFRKLDVDRFPLFLGSQFGIHPEPEEYLDADTVYIIAIYGKSLLSGCVSGLMLYRLRPGDPPGERNRIMTFSNY